MVINIINKVCPICNRPYVKPWESGPVYCSNSFHCCRDCIWENGKRIRVCHDCKILEKNCSSK